MSSPLTQAAKIATQMMNNAQIKARVAVENMANHQSPNYIPKEAEFRAVLDRKHQQHDVNLKKIHQRHDKMTKVYTPDHPNADEKGYISMPTVDPMITMMDVKNAQIEQERALQIYQSITQQKRKTIQAIGR